MYHDGTSLVLSIKSTEDSYALDPKIITYCLDYLNDIIKDLKGKITIILTTHYMNEAESLSDRVGIMKNGRLIACGNIKEIKDLAQSDSFENAFVKLVKEN